MIADHLPPAIIRAQLDRILSSQTFAQAPMLRRLLQYLVEHSLDGEQDELKEYAVGVDVFDRGPDFDPRTDTIVRVQARRLRAKLDDYYRGAGAADPVILQVPRGHYVVVCQLASPPRDAATDVSRGPTLSRARASGVADDTTGTAESSIVVLPFANLSGDADNEYFTDGLTEEIISTLASLADLRVVARTSAFQFKGRSDDIRKIGRELGVQTALEGSVRKDGHRIRVTAQLINVADGFHLWSHIYDGALPGVFSLQEETTRSIVEALRIRLRAGEQDRLCSLKPASIEAYELYLKGRYLFHKAGTADLAASIQCMQRAVALDANYAAAYAGMADAYLIWATMGDQPAPELLSNARQAAERALELGDLAEAHCAMAGVLAIADWDLVGAEREFRRALELKPSFVYARMTYAATCLCIGRRFDDALQQLRLARTIDPVSLFVRGILGQTLVLAGRPAEAVEELHQALELEPDFVFGWFTLAFAHLTTRSYPEAMTALQPIQHLAGQFPNCAGHLGYTHACMGNRSEAERVLQMLLDRFPGAWAPWIDVAAIYNGLGEGTKALEWLERGYQQRCFDSLFLSEDPRFVNLHSNSRFKQLLEKVSMVRTVPDAVT